MDVEMYKDLIRDERGNYYIAVQMEGNELTLVNAFVEASFTPELIYNEDFRNKHKEMEGGFVGKIAMDLLRHDVVMGLKQMDRKLLELSDVEQKYTVNYIDTIEFYRHPAWERKA
ncbi:hypothetical protein [Paenibacillus taichungensis]|uniref:hypothetical protein n=1 Tax=Paenibacillus taichungensis TaxID=484184 RepID=UPI0028717BAD|nr:hypothetical protein [Paenibacillus taichungensis]MDR9745316.1 hypothetical protein [Paenibacillus taichungensis]